MTIVDPNASAGSDTTWSSPTAGWHARATPLSGSERTSFEPSLSALVFASIHSTPVNPEGFTLALFTPDLAVDARGALLRLTPDDFSALSDLARMAVNPNEVPETGTFRNQWAIAHPITSRPIDRLLVPSYGDIAGEFKEVQVSGYQKGRTRLRAPVGEKTELPDVLHELFGLIQEGSEDGPGEPDETLVGRVKVLLEGVL
jgi:hypothetical protein